MWGSCIKIDCRDPATTLDLRIEAKKSKSRGDVDICFRSEESLIEMIDAT